MLLATDVLNAVRLAAAESSSVPSSSLPDASDRTPEPTLRSRFAAAVTSRAARRLREITLVPVPVRADQEDSGDALHMRLLQHLTGELLGWAGVDDSLTKRPSSPLRDQETNQGFARASRKLKCYVQSLRMVPGIVPKLVGLMRPHRAPTPPGFRGSSPNRASGSVAPTTVSDRRRNRGRARPASLLFVTASASNKFPRWLHVPGSTALSNDALGAIRRPPCVARKPCLRAQVSSFGRAAPLAISDEIMRKLVRT